jgi:DNA-binding PadR family transcriptional regulator
LQRDWITRQWKASPNGRRAKYYRLTPAGRQSLADVLEAEIAAQLNFEIDENVARGMPPDAARQAARRRTVAAHADQQTSRVIVC